MLYDIKAIKIKALKYYENGELFKNYMMDLSDFNFTINLQKPTQKKVLENIKTIPKELKEINNMGVKIILKEFSFKSLGSQKFPIAICFESFDEFLKFVNKKDEFNSFKIAYNKLMLDFSQLKYILVQKPKILRDNIKIIDTIIAVCKFFKNNPRPNIYIRELSIEGVDTKFIQKNRVIIDMFLPYVLEGIFYDKNIEKLSENGFEKKYGLKYEEPLIRFRLLDERLYINGMNDISVPISVFKNINIECKNIFIIENKITTLSFANMSDSIVVFGKGYAIGMLKGIQWMQNKNIYYWGDIDMDGFAILSQARGHFANLKSFLMDKKTIEIFKILAVSSSDKVHRNLEYLTNEEQIVYERLHNDYYEENFRLEQEKIPFEYVLKEINAFR